MKGTVTVIEAKLNDKSDKIILLEQKQETMRALDNVAQNASAKALERIENDLKVMQADVKEIRTKQIQILNTSTVR